MWDAPPCYLASQRFKATERALWHGALLRSVETGVAVYDTLFVELAEREGAPLVTFDQRPVEELARHCVSTGRSRGAISSLGHKTTHGRHAFRAGGLSSFSNR
jgi:hypothetical protein